MKENLLSVPELRKLYSLMINLSYCKDENVENLATLRDKLPESRFVHMMNTIIAYTYYLKGKITAADNTFVYTIEEALEAKDYDSVLYVYSVYVSTLMHSKYSDRLNTATEALETLNIAHRDNPFNPDRDIFTRHIVSSYFYMRGVISNSEKNKGANVARKYFMQSEKYATDRQKVYIYNGLGLSYKREKKFRSAIKYYQKALLSLRECERSNESMKVNELYSTFYNNLAMVYIDVDSLRSKHYIQKAFETTNEQTPINRVMNYFDTYIQITGNDPEIDVFIKIVDKLPMFLEAKENSKKLIEFVDKILLICKENNYLEVEIEILSVIKEKIKKERNPYVYDYYQNLISR